MPINSVKVISYPQHTHLCRRTLDLVSKRRTPHKVYTEQPLHAKWTFEKENIWPVHWLNFPSKCPSGSTVLVARKQRFFSGINSCHSKCLWVSHLLESWFPTNSGTFSLSLPQSRYVRKFCVYIWKELWGYCGRMKFWSFNIIYYNGAIFKYVI